MLHTIQITEVFLAQSSILLVLQSDDGPVELVIKNALSTFSTCQINLISNTLKTRSTKNVHSHVVATRRSNSVDAW